MFLKYVNFTQNYYIVIADCPLISLTLISIHLIYEVIMFRYYNVCDIVMIYIGYLSGNSKKHWRRRRRAQPVLSHEVRNCNDNYRDWTISLVIWGSVLIYWYTVMHIYIYVYWYVSKSIQISICSLYFGADFERKSQQPIGFVRFGGSLVLVYEQKTKIVFLILRSHYDIIRTMMWGNLLETHLYKLCCHPKL